MKDEDIEKRKLLFIIHENKLDDIVENNAVTVEQLEDYDDTSDIDSTS